MPGFAFRFYVVCNGERVYSDPFEYDVYYALTIKSKIEGSDMEKSLMAWNTNRDINMGDSELIIPARYNDTVRISQLSGANGACLTYARVNQPSRDLYSGIDEKGIAYIICPGEKETVEVGIARKLVVFDGVYGNGYPKPFDFSAEGFAKINNAYYAEIANCGGKVLPEDPTMDGYIFKGWEAWNSDYADTAYLNVPAVSDNVIGFTAKFEELPTAPQYTVYFYGADGTQLGSPKRAPAATDPLLASQQIEEGLNATPPDVPHIEGYHFIGWDREFSIVLSDLVITATFQPVEEEGTPTDVENVEAGTDTDSRKVIRNGVLYIERNGTLYNAQGAELR